MKYLLKISSMKLLILNFEVNLYFHFLLEQDNFSISSYNRYDVILNFARWSIQT